MCDKRCIKEDAERICEEGYIGYACNECLGHKMTADLPEAGASAERISSVVRSNATTGWISVKDRLPNVKQKVMILNTYGEITDFYKAVIINKKSKHKIWMNPDTGYIYGGEVTHWMPLPDAPKV